MVDLKVPNACTDCGGSYSGSYYTPGMMFDDETEAPPSSYGYGADSRTAWVRKFFKFLLSSLFGPFLPIPYRLYDVV